jgi:hypothetical protein
MQTKTIIKFGMAALAMGVFFGVNLPVKVKADQVVWVRAPKLNYFEARGLVPPFAGFYCKPQVSPNSLVGCSSAAPS